MIIMVDTCSYVVCTVMRIEACIDYYILTTLMLSFGFVDDDACHLFMRCDVWPTCSVRLDGCRASKGLPSEWYDTMDYEDVSTIQVTNQTLSKQSRHTYSWLVGYGSSSYRPYSYRFFLCDEACRILCPYTSCLVIYDMLYYTLYRIIKCI